MKSPGEGGVARTVRALSVGRRPLSVEGVRCSRSLVAPLWSLGQRVGLNWQDVPPVGLDDALVSCAQIRRFVQAQKKPARQIR